MKESEKGNQNSTVENSSALDAPREGLNPPHKVILFRRTDTLEKIKNNIFNAFMTGKLGQLKNYGGYYYKNRNKKYYKI